jgi:predicted amidohydrolase
MRFRLACVQFSPNKAELDLNLDFIAYEVRQAKVEGADVVLFPEASTSGYFLEGGVIEVARSAAEIAEALHRRLGADVDTIDVALGFYEREGGDLYNSAGYFEVRPEGVNVRAVYQKIFLPTYGVFDEERFVSTGHNLSIFNTRFGRFAFLICEDVWHSIMPTLVALGGAEVVLVPAASPARGFSGPDVGNHDRYRRLFQAMAEEHGVFTANAQLTGFEGGKGFIGGSSLVNPFGETLVEAELGRPQMIVGEVDPELITLARAQSPLLSDLRTRWQVLRRMIDAPELSPTA